MRVNRDRVKRNRVEVRWANVRIFTINMEETTQRRLYRGLNIGGISSNLVRYVSGLSRRLNELRQMFSGSRLRCVDCLTVGLGIVLKLKFAIGSTLMKAVVLK